MFGKYALYLEGRVVALVCGNQLFMPVHRIIRSQLQDDESESSIHRKIRISKFRQ